MNVAQDQKATFIFRLVPSFQATLRQRQQGFRFSPRPPRHRVKTSMAFMFQLLILPSNSRTRTHHRVQTLQLDVLHRLLATRRVLIRHDQSEALEQPGKRRRRGMFEQAPQRKIEP